jgi:uncharacterized RDD family membrane protein YckC
MESADTPTQIPLEIQPYPLPIAGYWKRFFASMYDGAIISIVLVTVTLIFREFFFTIGPYGRLFGWGAAVAYFTYYHSSSGGGQTPGKRMMSIVVLTPAGKTLTWQAAFMRAQALCIIILFNNGWQFKPIQQELFGNIIYGAVYIGGLLALIYGIIINRTTRQGPHDLIVGSYVVEQKENYIGYDIPHQPVQHYFRMLIILLIGAFLGVVVQQNQGQDDLLTVLNQDDRYFAFTANRVDDQLTIRAWYGDECEEVECQALIEEIGRVTINTYDEITEIKSLDIILLNKIDVNPILILEVSSVFTRQVEGLRFELTSVPLE